MRSLRGWMAVPAAVLLLAGGVWSVSAGWTLDEVVRDTVSAREFGQVRTVLVSAAQLQVPERRLFATAHRGVTDEARIARLGRLARLLLLGGLLTTPVGGLLLATGLRLLTADPKKQTTPYAPTAP